MQMLPDTRRYLPAFPILRGPEYHQQIYSLVCALVENIKVWREYRVLQEADIEPLDRVININRLH